MQQDPVKYHCPFLSEDNHAITSKQDPIYNCVAWSLNYNLRYIWPDEQEQYAWPPSIPREETIAAFIKFYKLCGFYVCQNAGLEKGIEKIALFVDENDRPTHAARQLANGRWASKIGDFSDIEHIPLGVVGGRSYGAPKVVFSRKRTSSPIKIPPLYPPPGIVTSSGKRLSGIK